MPEKPKVGCERPTGGVVGQPQTTEKQPLPSDEKEVPHSKKNAAGHRAGRIHFF